MQYKKWWGRPTTSQNKAVLRLNKKDKRQLLYCLKTAFSRKLSGPSSKARNFIK
jgi:hypothetical protein